MVAVVGEVERVVANLVGGGLVLAFCGGEAVEVVVAEALLVGAAEGGGRGDVDLVVQVEDVADLVITVVQVLEGAGAGAGAGEGIEAAAGGVVGVLGLDAVAEIDAGALLELVVVDEVEVADVGARFVAGKGLEAAAGVVDVGDDLAVGEYQLEQTAEAVVAVARGDLGAVLALALGVRGDGADFPDGLAEAAVVELLAAGGVGDLD